MIALPTQALTPPAGLAQCPLSHVSAEALENLAWDDLAEALLDPERLQRGLAAAHAEYEATSRPV